MTFIFEPHYRGWYPSRFKGDGATFRRFVTSHSTMLFHDFVDHGPEADFSLENEQRAVGAARWTRSGASFVDRAPEDIPFWEGYEAAKRRWPRGVRMTVGFDAKLGALLDLFDAHKLEVMRAQMREGLRVTIMPQFYNITLFADEAGDVDFYSGAKVPA